MKLKIFLIASATSSLIKILYVLSGPPQSQHANDEMKEVEEKRKLIQKPYLE
jgi:hypothetical protein